MATNDEKIADEASPGKEVNVVGRLSHGAGAKCTCVSWPGLKAGDVGGQGALARGTAELESGQGSFDDLIECTSNFVQRVAHGGGRCAFVRKTQVVIVLACFGGLILKVVEL